MKNERSILLGVCALVIGIFIWMSGSGAWESIVRSPADDAYNMLVQGFRAGQLSLKAEVPAGLTQLPDPYDPSANAAYTHSLLDLSYYRGRLYLYFGVAPALLLFWPFVALTHHYLFESHAVTVFCAVGFLTSVALLRAIWRRYFSEVSVWVVVACILALGLATGLPTLLARSQVYEVPVSCGYMLTMLALAAVWSSLHKPDQSWQFVAVASAAYGLALGARPNLLLGSAILLMPVAQSWRKRRPVALVLVAACVPITLIGLGLLLYNKLRFDDPFEFGLHYQLSPTRLLNFQAFSLRYLWFNMRVYFLQPARWSGHFPFAQDIAEPPMPRGHASLQTPFGVLTNVPIVWAALAVPLALRNRSTEADSALSLLVRSVGLLFAVSALTNCCYAWSSFRYEVDFLPALVLLAVIGVLGSERVLALDPNRGERLYWRYAIRGILIGLVVFSVTFNILAAMNSYAEAHYEVGTTLLQQGRPQDAVDHYEKALRLKPEYSQTYNNLGFALVQLGRVPEAIEHYQQALKLAPNSAAIHYNLGVALLRAGEAQGALRQFEETLRIEPDHADAHYDLGVVLGNEGRLAEAIPHLERALEINPNLAAAHNNLGIDLAQVGRLAEAIEHFKRALELNPNLADAHYNLGIALEHTGRWTEAIEHLRSALQLNPELADAHCSLAQALEKLGHIPEAVEHYRQALKLRPDFAPAKNALSRLGVAL